MGADGEQLPSLGSSATVSAVMVGAIRPAGEAEKELGHDAGPITIDEAIGQSITLLFCPHRIGAFVLAFALFRLFDIWKPPLADKAQELPGGLGIVADDVVAGIVALIVLQVTAMATADQLAAAAGLLMPKDSGVPAVWIEGAAPQGDGSAQALLRDLRARQGGRMSSAAEKDGDSPDLEALFDRKVASVNTSKETTVIATQMAIKRARSVFSMASPFCVDGVIPLNIAQK